MAYAIRVEAQPSLPDGVVWSTRRRHLAVVAAPSSVPVERPTVQQYRRRRQWAAFGVLSVVGVAVFTVASWADRRVGEPLGDPRPAIPWSAPAELSGS